MFGLLLPMSGGAAASTIVPRRIRRRISVSRVVLQIGLVAPAVLVQGWTTAPVRASIVIRWSTPLVEVMGRSVPASRIRIQGVIGVELQSVARVRVEPPAISLSDHELLLLADQFLND